MRLRLPAFRFLFFFAESARKGRKQEEDFAPARPEMLFDIVDRASRGGIALAARDNSVGLPGSP
jgi:hypothetical protein